MVTTFERRNSNPLLIILILVAAVVWVVVTYGAHATAIHGADAVRVRECMENNGPYQVWVKPDGRVVNVCLIEPGVWGLMITDGTREVTSFIKNKMKSILDVERYLRNMGAWKIQ